jgi:hypothetical protein
VVGTLSSLSRFRRQLYRAARDMGDVEAAGSGNPAKVVKRVVRRRVYREEGKLTRRVPRRFGL